MPILKSWEETCAKIAEISEYNPAISVISEADRVSAHTVRERSNAAPKNDKPHPNDDQKISDQLVFSVATELSSPSVAENPVSIEQKARSNDPAPPSNVNAQEITKNQQNKIKPRVVNVAEVFNFAGKNDENAGLVESAGKVVADGVGQRSSKTRKISPVYAESTSSSEETDSKSFSGIEILSLKNDEKTKQADRPEEMKSTKPDKYLVELEIANGFGVKGAAGRIRDLLKENGFKIVKITNANFNDHINTKIFYYNGHRRTVDRIMQKLSCCADERNIIELENLGNRIKIIIGKDLSPPVWKKAERSASGDQS
jgi:hypothetical protein